MINGVRKGYRTLFLITVTISVLFFALDTFGAFDLRTVTLDGRNIKREDSRTLGFAPGSSVFRQPLDVVASLMCRRKGIGSAHVAVVSAHEVDIRTNQFSPAYLVYDSGAKRLRGLTNKLTVAPLDVSQFVESAPMFIGLKDVSLFERPGDYRLQTIVEDLDVLRDDDEDLFTSISAIDCSNDEYITVSFRNNETLLQTSAFAVAESIMQLQLLLDGATEITGAPQIVDMRFGGLVIIPQDKQKKKKRG